MLEINKIYCGDTKQLMMELEEESIDVCITSPPYWGLRDYGVEGQIGLEEHPNQYIEKLVTVFHYLKKALKKTGSFYLNLGDTYFGGNLGVGQPEDWESISTDNKGAGFSSEKMKKFVENRKKMMNEGWLQPKQLMLIPSRTAMALQEDGWILRNDIIWHKPNPMPSSVKDRLNTTYEHIFHFVKSKKYYYDLDTIREPHGEESLKDLERRKSMKFIVNKNVKSAQKGLMVGDGGDRLNRERDEFYNPLGKNPGDVLGSKYNGTEGHTNRAGLQREPTLREKRVFEVIQNQIANYIRKYLTIDKKKVLDGIFGKHKWTHWIRTDESGASLPSPEDWVKLKDILVFDDTFDKIMTKTEVYLDDGMMWKNKPKNPGDFWSITTKPYPEAHFAVFPPEILIKPLKSSCPYNGLVLDPFIGSGTVAYVCKYPGKFGIKKRLNFIGFDINLEYVKMANKRLSQNTLLEVGDNSSNN